MPDRVLGKWLDAVNAGDVDRIAQLYSDHAVLLPTFSDQTRLTDDDRRDYFLALREYNRVHVEWVDGSVQLQKIDDSIYTASGLYHWELEGSEGTRGFDARFTFTLDVQRPHPILHHHSSQIPAPE